LQSKRDGELAKEKSRLTKGDQRDWERKKKRYHRKKVQRNGSKGRDKAKIQKESPKGKVTKQRQREKGRDKAKTKGMGSKQRLLPKEGDQGDK
jgi:hypothetical protein